MKFKRPRPESDRFSRRDTHLEDEQLLQPIDIGAATDPHRREQWRKDSLHFESGFTDYDEYLGDFEPRAANFLRIAFPEDFLELKPAMVEKWDEWKRDLDSLLPSKGHLLMNWAEQAYDLWCVFPERRGELTVTPEEFSRIAGYYVERFHAGDNIKTLKGLAYLALVFPEHKEQLSQVEIKEGLIRMIPQLRKVSRSKIYTFQDLASIASILCATFDEPAVLNSLSKTEWETTRQIIAEPGTSEVIREIEILNSVLQRQMPKPQGLPQRSTL